MMRFKQLKLEQNALQCSGRALVDMSMGLNSDNLEGEITNYSCKMMLDDASGNLTSENVNEVIDDLL